MFLSSIRSSKTSCPSTHIKSKHFLSLFPTAPALLYIKRSVSSDSRRNLHYIIESIVLSACNHTIPPGKKHLLLLQPNDRKTKEKKINSIPNHQNLKQEKKKCIHKSTAKLCILRNGSIDQRPLELKGVLHRLNPRLTSSCLNEERFALIW